MALVVQKFGGTSVATVEAREALAGQVARERGAGNRVVVVVSAMGRAGAPYATDTLLGLVPSATPMVRDLVASCGEVISACVVAELLRTKGVEAVPLTAYTAGVKAEGPSGDAEPVAADSSRIRGLLEEGVVPVVAGFQGVDAAGDLVTLGRGGSDTSAVAIGAFIGADRVDIFTDVPGVAQADPRLIPEARFLPYFDYRSMYRLAANGARVLHDRSALIGERYGVLIRVRSTFDSMPGTAIGPDPMGADAPALLGVAVAKGAASARVAVVLREGTLAARLATLVAAAEAAGGRLEASGDADVAAFSCALDSAPSLAKALFAAAVE